MLTGFIVAVDRIIALFLPLFFFQNLVYSYDEKMPLHFDSEITDRYGRRHGFTSMIIFGSMYRFQLGWKDKTLRFFHNFTVSVYPHDYKTIYSHTFFIATENITETSRTPGKQNFLMTFRIILDKTGHEVIKLCSC